MAVFSCFLKITASTDAYDFIRGITIPRTINVVAKPIRTEFRGVFEKIDYMSRFINAPWIFIRIIANANESLSVCSESMISLGPLFRGLETPEDFTPGI